MGGQDFRSLFNDNKEGQYNQWEQFNLKRSCHLYLKHERMYTIVIVVRKRKMREAPKKNCPSLSLFCVLSKFCIIVSRKKVSFMTKFGNGITWSIYVYFLYGLNISSLTDFYLKFDGFFIWSSEIIAGCEVYNKLWLIVVKVGP